ncbi:MAG: acetoacetate decarboxylase family protein [Bacteriovoracaceae bacterium]
MKISTDIPSTLIDNRADFHQDFYKRFTLRHADQPIKLTSEISKNYLFPTLYGNVTCALGIFHCDYNKAAALVAENLNQTVKPIKMTKGRSLVAISCYEYKNVLGIKPYNEIAVAIPIMVNASFNPPILPMILDKFSHFGYYIASMPVTSYENMLRGRNIWGLPKVTEQIDIEKEGDFCVTKAYDDLQNVYLKLKVPMHGKATEFDVTSHLYSKLNGKILQSKTHFKATFAVTKYMNLLFKKGVKPDQSYLELSNSPNAKLLRDLDIEEHPFQFRYAEGMTSCFDLANKVTPSWLSF